MALLSITVIVDRHSVANAAAVSEVSLMPTYARRQIVAEDRVGVYHCIARCVRRAFLCGIDAYTRQDFSYRKEWILDRVRELAGLFAVEVCGYSVMGNHLLDSGPIAGVTAGVEAPRRLRVRASDQGFLPIPARSRQHELYNLSLEPIAHMRLCARGASVRPPHVRDRGCPGGLPRPASR